MSIFLNLKEQNKSRVLIPESADVFEWNALATARMQKVTRIGFHKTTYFNEQHI